MEVERKVNSKIYITRLLLQIELNNQMRNRTNLVVQTVSPGKKKKTKKTKLRFGLLALRILKRNVLLKTVSVVGSIFITPVSNNSLLIL